MCSGHFVAAPDVEAKGTLFTDGDEWSSSRHVGRAAMWMYADSKAGKFTVKRL